MLWKAPRLPIPLTIQLCGPSERMSRRHNGDVQVKGSTASHRQTIPVPRQNVFREKLSADQFLHRLEGAARQDAFSPCLADGLQAQQIVARRLVDVNRPNGPRLRLLSPPGLCAGRFRPLPVVVRSVTAEGVVGNGGTNGADGYGSNGSDYGLPVQFHSRSPSLSKGATLLRWVAFHRAMISAVRSTDRRLVSSHPVKNSKPG